MKINIYYGGRGYIDDPTIFVLEKIENVLAEFNVEYQRYNIYEQKNNISTMPNTLTGVDGIILATTVEWMGIGGNMTSFLDACWFYANKEELSKIYMMPVVISTTYGEREALLTLENAWEILGGVLCSGLCGYVDNLPAFESNEDYQRAIEKKATNLYKTITQRTIDLPNSNKAVSKTVLRTSGVSLTPDESEQLSQYASDESYVARQKQDVMELTNIYKDLLGQSPQDSNSEFINPLLSHFVPKEGFKATYRFDIEDRPMPLLVFVDGSHIKCEYGQLDNPDVLSKITPEVFHNIINGRLTFTRAFTTSEMSVRGSQAILRSLDNIFVF